MRAIATATPDPGEDDAEHRDRLLRGDDQQPEADQREQARAAPRSGSGSRRPARASPGSQPATATSAMTTSEADESSVPGRKVPAAAW